MHFHYDGNHGDQICDAATKPLQTSLSTKKIKYVHVHACHCLSGICLERVFHLCVIRHVKCHYCTPKCTFTVVSIPLTASNLHTHLVRSQNAHSNINERANSLFIIIQWLKSVSGRWISMCQWVHLPLFFLSWWCERASVKSPSIFVTFPVVLSQRALVLSKDTSKTK